MGRPRGEIPGALRMFGGDRGNEKGRLGVNGGSPMTYTTEVPVVTLHDGVEIPQLGFGVFQVPPRGDPAGGRGGAGGRLPAHRHRRRLSQRGRRRARRSRRPGSPATRSSSRPSCGTPSRATTRPCAPSSRASSGSGCEHLDLYLIHWPVPTAGPLPRDLAGLRTDHGEGGVALDRRLQLPRRGPRAAARARPSSCRP